MARAHAEQRVTRPLRSTRKGLRRPPLRSGLDIKRRSPVGTTPRFARRLSHGAPPPPPRPPPPHSSPVTAPGGDPQRKAASTHTEIAATSWARAASSAAEMSATSGRNARRGTPSRWPRCTSGTGRSCPAAAPGRRPVPRMGRRRREVPLAGGGMPLPRCHSTGEGPLCAWSQS
jgi:hypothetical protein